MGTRRAAPQKPWYRHFVYRKESWRTTWKLRLGLLALIILLVLVTQGYWSVKLAESLVCKRETPKSDALLLENFDPDYLVFEKAELLQREGVASRVFVPSPSGPDGEPRLIEKTIVGVLAGFARLPKFEVVPISVSEPITLNASIQIRDALLKEKIRSVVVVAPAFRSRRSALVYSTVFTPAGIRVSCEPVFGLQTTENWTETWHGIQSFTEHFGKLQYYRFWVIPRSKS
jgi:hypothetical protein